MIGAFIPQGYQGLTLLSMYLLSVFAALGAAWLLKRFVVKGESGTFLMELPRYKVPGTRHVLTCVAERAWVFVRQAGTVILAISVILWFLAYFPRSEEVRNAAEQRIEAGQAAEEVERWAQTEQVRQSFAGRMGRAIEPAIEPLGFDWTIGVAIISSFAAREVLVSSLGIMYSVGDADETSALLRERLQTARRTDGAPAFTTLTAVSLMVFFVLACQCMATLAVVKRETASWRWPAFMFVYMTLLAYVASLVVYQGGLMLGWGAC
jgi:ferrous iron transport protein B